MALIDPSPLLAGLCLDVSHLFQTYSFLVIIRQCDTAHCVWWMDG